VIIARTRWFNALRRQLRVAHARRLGKKKYFRFYNKYFLSDIYIW
jgi:hypothetical protein